MKNGNKVAPAEKTPLELAQDLVTETLATVKERAAWILKAADQGFVTFTPNTGKSKQNLTDIKDGKTVEKLDPTVKGYDIPVLPVEVGLARRRVQRWIDGNGAEPKSSIQFGSMIRASNDPHGRGKAIDINDLAQTTSVDPTLQIIEDLDKNIHTAYGLGLPFQGEFFDPADKLESKQKAAEEAADKNAKTAAVSGALMKFTAHSYKSTATKDDKGNWKWKAEEVDELGVAVDRLKSQKLKDKIAERRKDGLTFVVFPDNDAHLHVDVR